MDVPDLCPPWWPDILWPPHHGPPPGPLDEVLAALAIYQMASRFSDHEARAGIQRLVAPVLEKNASHLIQGMQGGKNLREA
jgi:hypothetical protein